MNNELLRSKAKSELGGKLFGETWLTMALICLLYGIIVGLGSSLSVGFGDEGQFRFSYGSIIGFVLGGAMSYGLARVTVNLGRGGSAKIENLFDGFKENFTQAMILGMVKNVLIMLWSLLLIVPGIMKAYSYSMASFIQQDADNKEWKHCLVTSKEVMDGKRKQLFWLDVGFIPYYLLGLICLGVGALWVAAWHHTARADFYIENVMPFIPELKKDSAEGEKSEAVVLPLLNEERPVFTGDPTENPPANDDKDDNGGNDDLKF